MFKITKLGQKKHQLYQVWRGIKKRCQNTNDKDYKNYGGRGIKVCDDWLVSVTFLKWADENGYKKGLQLDRINNDGNYEPSNCRFVTHAYNSSVGRKRKNANNNSGYTGVYFKNANKKWASVILSNKKTYFLGYFDNIESAFVARVNKEIELFGEQKTNL